MRRARHLLALGAWLSVAMVAAAVARRTTAGPVVLRFTEEHGVHAGDVVVLAAGAAVASVVTLLARRSTGR